MKINSRLRILLGVSIIALLVILVIIWGNIRRVNGAARQVALSNQMVHEITSMQLIMYDLEHSHLERAVEQWEAIEDRLTKIFSDEIFEGIEQTRLLHNIENDYQRIQEITIELQSLSGSVNGLESDDPPEEITYQRILDQQRDVLVLNIVNQSFQLQELVISNLIALETINNIVIVFLLAALTAVIMGTSYLLNKNQEGAISNLLQATQQVSLGNLDFNSPIDKKDEFHIVYAAFDQMAKQIQQNYSGLQEEINERKRIEEELRQSEERFHLTLANSPIVIFSQDLQLRYTWVYNPHPGFDPKVVLGKTDAEFLPVKDAARLTEIKRRVLETGALAREEVRTTIDGQAFFYDLIVEPFRDASGIITGVNCVSIDITERKQMESDLAENEEKYRLLFDLLPVGITVTDKNGKIIEANRESERLLGISIEHQLDRNYTGPEWNIIRPDGSRMPPEEYASVKALRKNRRVEDVEMGIVKEEDQVTWINVTAQPTAIKELGVVITYNDITDRVRAEEEKRQMEAHLRQNQKLESIGTLAIGVAHEINNPLMGIMNYAQLIHDRIDPVEGRLREFSAGIIEETERVATIVRNLLTFSRQEKKTYNPARITDIVDGTLSLIRTVIKQHQIILEVDLPDDLPEFKCRSQQIQQVLMNLLTNARDALNARYPEYDPDKIITLKVNLFEKEGRRWLRTTIEDHGLGIPVEIRERIFDPFYTTKDRATGTGLGLSISLGIVKDHHGELTFESEKDQPTRFYLDLPVDNSWDL